MQDDAAQHRRCLLLNDAQYIYSQIGNGEVMSFMLPPEWRGKEIEMVRLTRDGVETDDFEAIGLKPLYEILEDRIEFRFMVPHQPYRATLA